MASDGHGHGQSGSIIGNRKLQFCTGIVVTFIGGGLIGSALGNVNLGFGAALVIIGFMFMAKS